MSGEERGPDRRFPRAVYRHGTEPDARFSLANERTFLAWLRTSLALPLHPGLRLAASVVLVALGVLAPVQAWVGWARTERALRERRPLPAPALSGPLAVGLLLTGVLVLLGIVLP
jgi:putative membrane protein